MPKVAISGTTSWGKTLGVVLAREGLEMPITGKIYQVLYEGLDLYQAISEIRFVLYGLQLHNLVRLEV